jgi:hypothetical protein
MATEITPEQRQVVRAADDIPVEMVDPDTKQHYVLLKAEFYERIKKLIDFGDLTEEEKMADLQAWGKRAGWEDPEASVFDDLKPQ